MKEMRKFASIVIIQLMLMSGLFVIQIPNVDSFSSIRIMDTPEPVNREVLNLTMENEEDVTDHFWRAHILASGTEYNGTVLWNETLESAELSSSKNVTGVYALGGFTPALETSVSFAIKLGSYGFNGATLAFAWYGTVFNLISYNSKVRCSIIWYNETDVIKSAYVDSPIWGAGSLKWIKVDIDWYANRTFKFQFSHSGGTNIWTGWNNTRQAYDFAKPDTLWTSVLTMTWIPGSSATYDTNYSCYIDNVTQTIPIIESAIYSDIPNMKYTGMGFDGVYNETLVNATPVLESLGMRATYLFDDSYRVGNGTNDWTESDIHYILDAGQEFGIHTKTMSTYNETNTAILNGQFSTLLNYAHDYGWNYESVVWTSYGNDFAWNYSDYVYDKWDSVGRKMWLHWYTNQGGWVDEYNLSSGALSRGIPYAGYNHRIGNASDVPFSTWYDQINTSLAQNLTIIGLAEYWFRYSAPWNVHANVSSFGSGAFTVEYEHYTVWNDFQITLNRSIFGFDSRDLGVYDVTIGEQLTNLTYDGQNAIFNVSDDHSYVIPVTCLSDGNVTITITNYSQGDTYLQWDSNLSTTGTYYLAGLDSDSAYRVYEDGDLLVIAYGPSISFSSSGEHEYEVEIWYSSSVSRITILTIHFIGIGILVVCVSSLVIPVAEDIKKKRSVSSSKMTQDIIRGVVFIVIGLTLYGVLYSMFLG